MNAFLQKAAEVDHLLEQLGEEPSGQDLSIKSALHKKVLELRTSDASPSKLSRVSMQSDAEVMSTFSDVSVATSTLYVSEMSPGRQLKSRMLNNRMFVESIEMSDIRGPKGRKPSLTIPPPAEEEDDESVWRGFTIGPPDPPPVRTPPENNPPNKCNNTACSDHPSHTGNVVTVATLYLDNGGSSGQNTQTSSEFDHHHNEASVMHSLQGLVTSSVFV
ncbi:hypothetical protein BaRGS_00035612 [Batillaria attramentaria]|uniref:Uncharacterized protein n=1 Tax=Batillaria attramentaria TaxID=370345 RepID=A0ABD0JE37_9CAEN